MAVTMRTFNAELYRIVLVFLLVVSRAARGFLLRQHFCHDLG
ncbi:hypothetical protein NAL19_1594 [Pectobacterium sp. F1-1]|nr:hypothetical protein NAL19_1594 [Pectobacterium sp. F1-1]